MYYSDKQYNRYYEAIAQSMQPASYAVEESRLLDYGVFRAFPPKEVNCKSEAASSRKTHYNEYSSYAKVC